MVQQLALELRLREAEDRINGEVEKDLFKRYCPKKTRGIEVLQDIYMLNTNKRGKVDSCSSRGKRGNLTTKRPRANEKLEEKAPDSRKKRRKKYSSKDRKTEEYHFRNKRITQD